MKGAVWRKIILRGSDFLTERGEIKCLNRKKRGQSFFRAECFMMTALDIAGTASFGGTVKSEPDNTEDLLVSVRKVSSQGMLTNRDALREEKGK